MKNKNRSVVINFYLYFLDLVSASVTQYVVKMIISILSFSPLLMLQLFLFPPSEVPLP